MLRRSIAMLYVALFVAGCAAKPPTVLYNGIDSSSKRASKIVLQVHSRAAPAEAVATAQQTALDVLRKKGGVEIKTVSSIEEFSQALESGELGVQIEIKEWRQVVSKGPRLVGFSFLVVPVIVTNYRYSASLEVMEAGKRLYGTYDSKMSELLVEGSYKRVDESAPNLVRSLTQDFADRFL